MNEYLSYLILISSVLLGGGLVYIIKNSQRLKLLLSFSGGYLLALAFTHLIPEIYVKHNESIGIWILGGFLLQIILEYFSKGIEHGHSHGSMNAANFFPTGLFISLCIHSLVEGFPLEREFHEHVSNHVHHHSDGHQHTLLWGIVLHKVPVAIALTTLLIKNKIKKWKIWSTLLLFSLMAPLGALIAHQFGTEFLNAIDNIFDKVLALVVGMLLHISTTIIYESSENHKFNLLKLVSVLAGVLLSMLTH